MRDNNEPRGAVRFTPRARAFHRRGDRSTGRGRTDHFAPAKRSENKKEKVVKKKKKNFITSRYRTTQKGLMGGRVVGALRRTRWFTLIG